MPIDANEVRRHERGLEKFLTAGYRARFRQALRDGQRDKVRADLPHFGYLDPSASTPVPRGHRGPAEIVRLLRDKGAPERCYLVSEDEDLDGREFDLEDAIETIEGSWFGTLVSCIPGELGYFRGEYSDDRYIVESGWRGAA